MSRRRLRAAHCGSRHAARVFDAGFARFGGQFEDVGPTVAEVVLIEDDDRRVMREGEVGETHGACLEGPAVGPAILVELGRTVCQSADVELVKVVVCPAECSLKHFVELGEVEVHRQFERAGDRRLDAYDVDVRTGDEGVGFDHGGDNVARPRRRQSSATIIGDNHAAISAAAAAVLRR